jgi:hypothetical protein
MHKFPIARRRACVDTALRRARAVESGVTDPTGGRAAVGSARTADELRLRARGAVLAAAVGTALAARTAVAAGRRGRALATARASGSTAGVAAAGVLRCFVHGVSPNWMEVEVRVHSTAGRRGRLERSGYCCSPIPGRGRGRGRGRGVSVPGPRHRPPPPSATAGCRTCCGSCASNAPSPQTPPRGRPRTATPLASAAPRL